METLSETDETAAVAALLKVLGEPTRLRIFQFLRGCCRPVVVDEETGGVRPIAGPTVGEVCCHITGDERVTSTLSEHCKELRQAGLILMERRGRHTVCAVNPLALDRVRAFFNDDPDAKGNDNGKCC